MTAAVTALLRRGRCLVTRLARLARRLAYALFERGTRELGVTISHAQSVFAEPRVCHLNHRSFALRPFDPAPTRSVSCSLNNRLHDGSDTTFSIHEQTSAPGAASAAPPAPFPCTPSPVRSRPRRPPPRTPQPLP